MTMKRILFIGTLLGTLGLVAALSAASTHQVARTAIAKVSANPASGSCPGCPLCSAKHGATAARAPGAAALDVASSTHVMPATTGGSCPFSDPSKCPSSCPRTRATAATAIALK